MNAGPTPSGDMPEAVRAEILRLSLIARLAAAKRKDRRRMRKAYRLLLAAECTDVHTRDQCMAHVDTAFRLAKKLAKRL